MLKAAAARRSKDPDMTHPLRPALVTTLAGAAWLVTATLAQAQTAPAEPAASAPQQPAPEAAPQLAIPAVAPPWAGETADAGAAAGAAGGEIPAIHPVAPGQWSFTLSPYLWLAGIKSSTAFTPAATGRTLEANVDKKFSNILNDLNFAIMTGAEARRGRYSLQTDVMYTDVLQTGNRIRDVTGPFGEREAALDLGSKVRLKTTVWTLTGGYDIFRNDVGFVQLFGGFRYLRLNTALDWNLTGSHGNLARAGSIESTSNIWNGIAGLRGEHALGAGPWKAVYYGDVGAGGSKLTWQALGQVAWVHSWGDVALGWRYMEFRQGTQNATANLKMNGPLITLNWRFGG
jgi:hypothetical protein